VSDVKARHDKMVELVGRMLDPSAGAPQVLHKDLPEARTSRVWANGSRPAAGRGT
jgi:hypothetical protein